MQPSDYSEQVQEMRAAARAANAREENPGDHRPNVYREDGTWIYRASAVGGCPRALWSARMGVERSPISDTLMKAFREGSNSEDIAIQMAREKFFMEITDPQHEYHVDVRDGDEVVAVVRGHLDGLGRSSGTDQDGNIEVKMLGPDLWKKSHTARFNAIPHWLDQVQMGMRGSGRRLTWMIWGKKDSDGVCEDVSYTVVEYNARHVAQVLARIKENERAVAEGREIECVTEEFGCPYWTLHEGKKGDRPEIEEIQDDRLAKLAELWLRAKGEATGAKKRAEVARDAYLKVAEEMKVGEQSARFGDLIVRRTVSERRNIARAALENDGLLDKYSSINEVVSWTVDREEN